MKLTVTLEIACIMYLTVETVLRSKSENVMYVPSVSFGFSFVCVCVCVWTELHAVKFQMLHTVAHVSGNWSIILYIRIVLFVWLLMTLKGETVEWPKVKRGCTSEHPMLCLETEFKRRGKWRVNLFFILCVVTGPILYSTNEDETTQRNINHKTEEKYTQSVFFQ